jgi:hypothetical protein
VDRLLGVLVASLPVWLRESVSPGLSLHGRTALERLLLANGVAD